MISRIADRLLSLSSRQLAKGMLLLALLLGSVSGLAMFFLVFDPSSPLGLWDEVRFAIVAAILVAVAVAMPLALGSVFLFLWHLFEKRVEAWLLARCSEKSRQIIAHLTADERRSLRLRGAAFGLLAGLGGACFANYVVYGWLTSGIVALVLGVMLVPLGLWFRRSARRLMCSTAYAKREGIRPEDL